MTTSIPAMPSFFLSDGTVTELNRRTIWESLTSTRRSEILSNPPQTSTSTGSGTSTGTTGTGTSGTGSTGTPTGNFVSRGSSQQNALPANVFANRLDYFSATPTAETLQAFAKIWATEDDIASQITARDPATPVTSATRGALFIDLTRGSVAEGTRLANPFGSFVDGVFVPIGTATQNQYFAFEDAIRKQEDQIRNLFGGTQGLLGYDANDNGRIDNESELFGFDNAALLGGVPLSLDNLLQTRLVNGVSEAGLSYDVNYTSSDPADRINFNRFMVLTGNGNSVRMNQFDLEFNSAIGSYTAAQTLMKLQEGGSSLTIRTEQGFNVTQIVA